MKVRTTVWPQNNKDFIKTAP